MSKKQMNKYNKTETELQIQRTNRWLSEGTMVREISQTEDNKHCMISLMCGI